MPALALERDRAEASERPQDGGQDVESAVVATGNVADLSEGLLARGLISADALARARSIEADNGEDLATILTRLGILSEAALVEFYRDATALPLVAAGDWPAAPVLPAGEVSLAFLRAHLVLPLAREGGTLVVATADPLRPSAAEALGQLAGASVTCRIAARGEIEAAIDRLYGDGRADADPGSVADEEDLERLRDPVSYTHLTLPTKRIV